MRLSAHLPLILHRRPIIWIVLAAAVLMIWSAAFSQAAEPSRTSRTAVVIAFMRALGAQDPDPKTRNPDYLAAKILNLERLRAKAGWTLDFEPMVKNLNQKKSWIFYYVTARSKHIDKVLRKELKAGARQVVILGAGFDTRGYRFYPDFPQARFIEVDLPGTIAAKEKVMKTKLPDMPNNVVYAPIDFNTQDLGRVLAGVGYKKDQKTLFIWEGVVMYLEPSAVQSTLRFIARNSAPGSSVVFDYLPHSVVDGTYTEDDSVVAMANYVRSVGEPFQFGIDPDKSSAFLKEMGLKQASNVGHPYLVKNYLTGSNGKPFGTIYKCFWLTQAMVPGAGK